MSKSRSASGNKVIRRSMGEERGDPSQKALKVTMVVCLVGLVGVYLFAFAPKEKISGGTSPTPKPRPEAREAVASFNRDSLSTKSR